MRKVYVGLFSILILFVSIYIYTNIVRAQEGDAYVNPGVDCVGLDCGCYNKGSALGFNCEPGLEKQIVNCTATDVAEGHCPSIFDTITKCVNPVCATSEDCGCSHKPCVGIDCGCYNSGSSTGLVCIPPVAPPVGWEDYNYSLVEYSVPCTGDDFSNGDCDSYAIADPRINKCVNPLCPDEPDCICTTDDGGEPAPEPGDPTPTYAPGCWDDCSPSGTSGVCPAGHSCVNTSSGLRCTLNRGASPEHCELDDGADCWCQNACGCQDAISSHGMTFTCPQPDPLQPGKAIGGIIIGNPPACFKCTTPECEEYLLPIPPRPTIRYDELAGNQCKTYTHTIQGSDEPPSTCECDSEICCPNCQEPVVISGQCDASCNFDVVGPNGGCMCWGSNCNEITTEGPNPVLDPGTSGGSENPDLSCVQFPNAGVKEITVSCSNGSTCTKEVVIACSCNENPGPTPGGANPTPWYKLKDDQFHKLDAIESLIPASPVAYDADDNECDPNNVGAPDIRCFNLWQAGTVHTAGSTIELNGAPVSHRVWNRVNYTKSNIFTPSTFLTYVLARKTTNTIATEADLTNLQQNTVNILTDDLLISSNQAVGGSNTKAILEDPSNAPYVLIVRGDVTIDEEFNAPSPVTDSPEPVAIIAEGGVGNTGDLLIHHAVQTIGGIFVGDTLDFSYDTNDSPYPLKIKGNIISYTAADPLERNNPDPLKPSVFVVFDPNTYLSIIDLLSVRTYEWEELTP